MKFQNQTGRVKPATNPKRPEHKFEPDPNIHLTRTKPFGLGQAGPYSPTMSHKAIAFSNLFKHSRLEVKPFNPSSGRGPRIIGNNPVYSVIVYILS